MSPLKLPWNQATTAAFQLSEGFMRFLSWGTSFTGGGGGQYSLVNNVRGGTVFTGAIHGGTFFTPTPVHPVDRLLLGMLWREIYTSTERY